MASMWSTESSKWPEVAPGNVIYIERGGIEIARNVGQKAYYEILIELKD